MDQFLKNLQTQAEQNPLGALIVASMVLGGFNKLLRTHHEGMRSRAWVKEVARRERASLK